jgi:hypothetical protein
MTLYFFDFRHEGRITEDIEGTECETDQQARDEAVQALAEIAAEHLPRSGEKSDLAFIVRRADGRPVVDAVIVFEVQWRNRDSGQHAEPRHEG